MQEFFMSLGETMGKINNAVNGFVWGPVMLVLLIGTGVYLSVRTRFFQIGKFGHMMKNTLCTLFNKDNKADKSSKNITPFQAVSTALAGTIGTGNIAGVATAIVAGGPGAIFWMWVSAFFGMMTKYAEVVLAVRYRVKNAQGEHIGGPMYYIERGLGQKWLAVVFACLCVLASFGIGNMTQVNSMAGALNNTFSIPVWVTGIVVAAIVALVVIGGIKRIASVTSKIVPFMAIFYVLGGIIALIINFKAIPEAFASIFQGAFNLRAVGGGVLGFTIAKAMRFGFARGVFSNEAGLGSAPIAHAASDSTSPVKQGLWGIFEVFADTFVVCTMTALVVLTAQAGMLWQQGTDGAVLTAEAYKATFGSLGGVFISVAILFFALSTILGWSYYGEKAIGYIAKENRTMIGIYRVLFIACIILGSTMNLKLVWDISDTLNGMMAIPNLVALLALSGVVIKLTKDYIKDPALTDMAQFENPTPQPARHHKKR